MQPSNFSLVGSQIQGSVAASKTEGGKKVRKGKDKDRVQLSLQSNTSGVKVDDKIHAISARIVEHKDLTPKGHVYLELQGDGQNLQVAASVKSLSKRLKVSKKAIMQESVKGNLNTYIENRLKNQLEKKISTIATLENPAKYKSYAQIMDTIGHTISSKELVAISVKNPVFFNSYLEMNKTHYPRTYGEKIDSFIGETLARDSSLIKYVNADYLKAHFHQWEKAFTSDPESFFQFQSVQDALKRFKRSDSPEWNSTLKGVISQIRTTNPDLYASLDRELRI